MASKRYSVEQIVAKLREVERLQSQGLTIPSGVQANRHLGPDLLRWRWSYDFMLTAALVAAALTTTAARQACDG